MGGHAGDYYDGSVAVDFQHFRRAVNLVALLDVSPIADFSKGYG
jgi:hypothetical protein